MTYLHIEKMKSTDWYYDKLSGDLRQYRKAFKSYNDTVTMLSKLDPNTVVSLVNQYVPSDMRAEVCTQVLKRLQHV
jgi:hypothetical protein